MSEQWVVLVEVPPKFFPGLAEDSLRRFRGSATDLVSAYGLANRWNGHAFAMIARASREILDGFPEMPMSPEVEENLLKRPVVKCEFVGRLMRGLYLN